MRTVSILGATGSIGESTLDVIALHPDRYRVHALTARSNVDKLLAQCLAHRPAIAVMEDAGAAALLAERLHRHGGATQVLGGAQAIVDAAGAPESDTVVAAIVGAAGLLPALGAARAGKRILLANKEALVMTGQVFLDAVAAHGSTLLPVDSEHNAIFQSLPMGFERTDFGLDPGQGVSASPRLTNPANSAASGKSGVRRLLLTASGGPFRTRELASLDAVTPEEAVAHPNWVMGRKISVDSATMMNKGLEVIEAHWLFGAPPDKIDVVIHPQSVIHSMVEYADGSVLAQLGNPDMRTPIAQTLAYPERIAAGVAPFDIFSWGQFTFEPPDMQRFPCLKLAFDALRAGGIAPAVLNAANEVAVEAFLAGRLRFTAIAEVVERVLNKIPVTPAASLEAVLAADAQARALAQAALSNVRPSA